MQKSTKKRKKTKTKQNKTKKHLTRCLYTKKTSHNSSSQLFVHLT